MMTTLVLKARALLSLFSLQHFCGAGASGGVASSCRTVPPQFIPISQLVLMTVKTVKELDAE